MYCRMCGTQNDESGVYCSKCGAPLHQAPPPAPAVNDPIEALIPYKNTHALVAYYLGVFSIVPCFGIIIGIPALMLGLKGLKFSREHPEAKGRTHAWVGVVGGIFGIICLVAGVILGIIAEITKK